MATNQSVVEFLWEGRVVVRPPRCGEKGWEVDGVEVEGLNGGTVEGMDKEVRKKAVPRVWRSSHHLDASANSNLPSARFARTAPHRSHVPAV